MSDSTCLSSTWLTGECAHVDFLSDLHLHRSCPKTAKAFFDFLQHRPIAPLVVLGDLFEVWVGDDWLDDAGASLERQCLTALAQTALHAPVAWVCGNRDFLVGQRVHEAIGWSALNDPSVVVSAFGRCLVSHGDAGCLSDPDYMAFRTQTRSRAWQTNFLAHPLSERIALAQGMRAQSQTTQAQRTHWADVDLDWAIQQLRQNNCQHLVHGHTHRPTDQDLGLGLQRHVLSDWDLDLTPQGHHNAPHLNSARAQVLRWHAGGFERLNLLPS